MAEQNKVLKQKISDIEEQIAEKTEKLAAQKERCTEEQEEWLDMVAGLEEFDKDRLRCIIQQVNVYAEDRIEIVWNMDDLFSEMLFQSVFKHRDMKDSNRQEASKVGAFCFAKNFNFFCF